MQHAGVAELGHDRQQRIEPGVLLTCPTAAAHQQLWQALFDDSRKAVLRLLPCTKHTIDTADSRAVAVGSDRYGRVAQTGQCRGRCRNTSGVRRVDLQRRRCAEQPQRPDRAAMGIHAAGDAEHVGFAVAAQLAESFAQGLANFANGLRRFSHRLECWPQRMGRGVHQPQMQILVRTAATPIHQPRLGRQVGLVDQRLHCQVRQALGQCRLRLSCNECAHHQLLNLAGGL